LVAKNEKAVFSILIFDNYGTLTSSGTGFFISNTGIGITNYHVLKDASFGVIKLIDNTSYNIIEIIAANPDADLVKFRIENTQNTVFNFLSLNTSTVQKGENIFIIGNPQGLDNSVSEGIISSIRDVEGFSQIIQITAPISQGSSGSPVMTMDGKVIGVATFQFIEGQNLNFAVTSKVIEGLPTVNKTVMLISEIDTLGVSQMSKRALDFYYSKNFNAAIETYILKKKKVKLSEDDLIHLGNSYYSLDDLKNAEMVYNEIIAGNPENIQANLYLARTYSKKDPNTILGLAEPKFLKVINIIGNSVEKYKVVLFEAYSYMGYFNLQKRDYETAKLWYNEIYGLDLSNKDWKLKALSSLALIDYKMQDYEHALKIYLMMQELEPNEPKYKEAISNLKKVINGKTR
jgi:hypothetical protein